MHLQNTRTKGSVKSESFYRPFLSFSDKSHQITDSGVLQVKGMKK